MMTTPIDLNYLDVMGYTMQKMSTQGVFLTVPGTPDNTMTIGWGWIGYCWKKPIFTVVVRPQRHTFEMIKKAGCFTVSVPTDDSLRAALLMAGTKSGRDIDKFSDHGITAAPARTVNAPIVAECGLHFECRTLMTGDMRACGMDADTARLNYPREDFHEMFFGEITACYATDPDFAAKYVR